MKKFNITLFLLLCTSVLSAQWTQLVTTNNVEFSSIETNGNFIVAGADGMGVYVSTDNGDTWRQSTAGLTGAVYVRTIAIASSGIFVGTDNGVFFSSDSGITWNSRNSGITVPNILKIAVSGGNMFAVGDGGIYYSSNDGNNWSPANNGINNITMKDIIFAGSYVYAGGGGGHIFPTITV